MPARTTEKPVTTEPVVGRFDITLTNKPLESVTEAELRSLVEDRVSEIYGVVTSLVCYRIKGLRLEKMIIGFGSNAGSNLGDM